MLHDVLHDGMGAPDGVLEASQGHAEAMHGVLDALIEPTSELIQDIDAGTQRVQAPRVRAAPDRRDVDHGELPRAESIQSLPKTYTRTLCSGEDLLRPVYNTLQRATVRAEVSYLGMIYVQRDEVGSEELLLRCRRRAVGREEGEDVVAAGADEEQGSRQHVVGCFSADACGDVASESGELLDLLAHCDDGVPLRTRNRCWREYVWGARELTACNNFCFAAYRGVKNA